MWNLNARFTLACQPTKLTCSNEDRSWTIITYSLSPTILSNKNAFDPKYIKPIFYLSCPKCHSLLLLLLKFMLLVMLLLKFLLPFWLLLKCILLFFVTCYCYCYCYCYCHCYYESLLLLLLLLLLANATIKC